MLTDFLDLDFYQDAWQNLGDAFMAEVQAEPLIENPRLVSINTDFAEFLGIAPESLEAESFIQACSGNEGHPQWHPTAAVYAGHQFGGYTPRLGDGRAMLMGELKRADGQLYDFSLKGAGPTPFSRGSDGRAVLRSSIREYLCSEAMFSLGIPTTRSLALLTSDDPVQREQEESAAILVRMTPSHIRFGSFEYFWKTGKNDEVKELADYVMQRNFPALKAGDYYGFFKTVCESTARMVAQWQALGFAHGVMNTDNMSILGESFDYGPFAFLDSYDAGFICNHSDHTGFYAFDRQPGAGRWNCMRLAHALQSLLTVEELNEILAEYNDYYEQQFLSLMRAKLGLRTEQASDGDLIDGLFELLQAGEVDYTVFWRSLCEFELEALHRPLLDFLSLRIDIGAAALLWIEKYCQRLLVEKTEWTEAERQVAMKQVNPKYILRNYLVQEAITQAEAGDYSEVNTLLALLKKPFDEQPDFDKYAQLPPDWSKKIQISCSS